MNDEDLIERARRAYFRSEGPGAPQPNRAHDRVEGGVVILGNARGELARYRIGSRQLRRVGER